jgi:CheY-like chemotaxis protein
MIKLIMIDDNPMEHMVVQKMLSRYKLFKDASHCLDGRLIIDFLKEHRCQPDLLPDIIFTDLNMSHFTGWLFLEQFKALYASLEKNIVVYVISSSADSADKVAAEKYPFVEAFCQKPIKREWLEQLYFRYEDSHRMPVKYYPIIARCLVSLLFVFVKRKNDIGNFVAKAYRQSKNHMIAVNTSNC